MQLQQQNEKELAPWDIEEGLPRNIIVQFQSTKKEIKTQPIGKLANTRISFNLSKFLQKRRRKVPLGWDPTGKNSPERSNPEGFDSPNHSKRIQVTTIEPQDLYMNETVRLKEIFPSYSIKKQKQATFYKPQRYHSIHSSQEDKYRPILRRPLQTNKTDPRLLTRNLTSKTEIENILSTGKTNQQNGDLMRSFTDHEAKSLLQVESVEKTKIMPVFKKCSRSHKIEQIIQMIERKERDKASKRAKTQEGDSSLEQCLKTKKQLFLNLPKIQFTELYH